MQQKWVQSLGNQEKQKPVATPGHRYDKAKVVEISAGRCQELHRQADHGFAVSLKKVEIIRDNPPRVATEKRASSFPNLTKWDGAT